MVEANGHSPMRRLDQHVSSCSLQNSRIVAASSRGCVSKLLFSHCSRLPRADECTAFLSVEGRLKVRNRTDEAGIEYTGIREVDSSQLRIRPVMRPLRKVEDKHDGDNIEEVQLEVIADLEIAEESTTVRVTMSKENLTTRTV